MPPCTVAGCDQLTFFLINQQWISPSLDLLMAAVSSWMLWLPLVVVAMVLVAWRGGFRGRAFLVCLLVSIGICDGIVTQVGKKIISRPRPGEVAPMARRVDLEPVNPIFLALFRPVQVVVSSNIFPATHGRSFPSGHVMNNFAAAMVLTLFYRRWGWLYYGMALLVSWSRVYTGSHWPSDCLVSAMLATGLSMLAVAICNALWARFSPRLFPELARSHPLLTS